MPLAKTWLFFFCTTFKSAHLRLKSMVNDVRGQSLISTSALPQKAWMGSLKRVYIAVGSTLNATWIW